MFDRNKDLLLISFISLSLAILPLAQKKGESTVEERTYPNLTEEENNQTSYFKGVSYYSLDTSKRQESFRLNAEEFRSNAQTERASFTMPEGEIYLKNDSLFYRGERGIFNRKISHLLLKDKVSLMRGNSSIECGQLAYDINIGEMVFSGGVKSSNRSKETGDYIEVHSERAITRLALKQTNYFGKVQGRLRGKWAYGPTIYFWSDRLSFDLNKQYIKIDGRVRFKKDQFTAQGRWGEIFLEDEIKKLRYFVLHDDIELREKVVKRGDSNSYYRKAYAERLEGPVGGDNIVLTGRPRVFQNKDVIKGQKITLRKNNEMVEVDDANANFILR